MFNFEPIKVLLAKTKQPIKSREVFGQPMKELSYWSEPSRDIQKRGLSRKSKVSTVDVEIKRSGLRVSQKQQNKR